MDQFTDDLVREKILNCKICDELCTSDIFLVNGKGNVCGKCFGEKCGEDMKSRAELNTALILIIAKLMLPCKSKGCDKRVTSKMYTKHIKSCDFKIKPCPMKNIEDCDWSGSNFELTEHLLKNHDKHVIKGDNNIFPVKTSFSEPFSVKILSFDCQHYLLRTLIAVNKWFYALNPLVNSNESMEYSVKHKSVATSNNSMLIKTFGTLTKLNSLYNEQNLNENPNSTAVDIDSLKPLVNEENVLLSNFNLNPKGLDENILRLLECSVCMSIMRPPIYQCNSGYNICSICREKFDECPTCKEKWSDVRSLFMENLTTDVKYPCKVKQFGCKEIGIQGKIEKHEEMCILKTLKCNICMNTMRPPIFSCNSGHGVCFACKEINNKCSTCQNEWMDTRNDEMERLTVKVKYPCKYNKLGCTEIDIEKELKKHEEICRLGVEYKCPMLCDESGNFEFILKHLNDVHKDMEYNGELLQAIDVNEKLKWILYDSRLFRISYHCENSYSYCAVELVCSNENPGLYTFTSSIDLWRCHKERTQPLSKIFRRHLARGSSFDFIINRNPRES